MNLSQLGPNPHAEGGISATRILLEDDKGKVRGLLAEEGKNGC